MSSQKPVEIVRRYQMISKYAQGAERSTIVILSVRKLITNNIKVNVLFRKSHPVSIRTSDTAISVNWFNLNYE